MPATRIRSIAPRVGLALAALVLVIAAVTGSASPPDRAPARPDVLLITIDTLRADRMSGYGHDRNTSPNLDRLMAAGATFERARTVEPLTSPALCSVITGIPPHEHGSSRNGLRMRPGLESLPRTLERNGYRTAGFVGNWTLRDKLSGLAEHFTDYDAILNRKRWFGLVKGEATAFDINEAALGWLRGTDAPDAGARFIWVHYVEPHAPYRFWKGHAAQVGITDPSNTTRKERYDTEIAYVDAAIGDLLESIKAERLLHDPIVVFASDHGESLGEHDYWGHGRHLYEPTLHVPMSITWEGHVPPARIDAPAVLLDIAPTVLRMAGIDVPVEFDGFDWTAVMNGEETQPRDRVTHYQAHRGAVLSNHQSELARRSGLLEVALIDGSVKETFRIENDKRRVFDLAADPQELDSRADPKGDPTEALTSWMRTVYEGLTASDDTPPEPLDAESVEALRSLGYID